MSLSFLLFTHPLIYSSFSQLFIQQILTKGWVCRSVGFLQKSRTGDTSVHTCPTQCLTIYWLHTLAYELGDRRSSKRMISSIAVGCCTFYEGLFAFLILTTPWDYYSQLRKAQKHVHGDKKWSWPQCLSFRSWFTLKTLCLIFNF